MSAAQKKESERLAAAQSALDASPTHERMRATRANLPAHGSRTALLEAARASQSLVICGETGCGKSTQVPQYLLEEAIAAGTGAACTVLIAQPRRVAAISLAERVAAERGEAVGETVGYSIRHEGVHSAASTRLLFCTTGVILRRLQEDPSLAGVSHVVVDEAHERTADGDFLLMVLRRLLRTRDDLRVLLMSATLDATLFSSYFGDAPTLTIPGRTFEVTRRLSLLAACCLLLAACCLRLAACCLLPAARCLLLAACCIATRRTLSIDTLVRALSHSPPRHSHSPRCPGHAALPGGRHRVDEARSQARCSVGTQRQG